MAGELRVDSGDAAAQVVHYAREVLDMTDAPPGGGVVDG